MAQNLEDLINSLFDCVTSNPSTEFCESVTNSLSVLGSKQPALFLTAAHAFILQHNKLCDKDRSFLLNSINKVLEGPSVVEDCDEQQGLLIINLATQEMTLTKDSDDLWANSAKDVLVTLAKSQRFVSHVMDALLNKFTPGLTSPPHKYIVLTLAAVAQHNATGFIPFLTDILSRTVPLLSHSKQDAIRSAWSQSLCCFCESVLEFSSSTPTAINHPNGNDENCESSNVSIEVKSTHSIEYNYADQLESIYELVFPWTNSKDSKCRADAVECVGTLCLMISKERINRDLKKMVTMFLSLYKKTMVLEEVYAITKGMGNFLDACSSDDTLPVEHYLDDIFNAFFPHVCVVTEQSLSSEDSSVASTNPVQIKIRNEAFRCFNVAARRFADRQVYYLLHKMQNDKDSVKLGATNLMRHLLNSAGSQMEDKRSLITMGLKPLLMDESLSARVKMSICQLCVALADHGYVHPSAGGQHVIQFLLTNLVLKAEAIMTNKKQSSVNSMSNESVPLNQLHLQCAQALHTIANTCESAYTLLWPLLFEYICVEAYTPVVADLFKCLRILTTRARESNQKLDFVTDFDATPRIAGPQQVMARLFVCMNGAPLNSTLLNRAVEALKVLDEISIWFNEAIPAVLKEQLPQMLAILEEEGPLSTDHLSASTKTEPSHQPRFGQKKSRSADYSTLELRCARSLRWQADILDLLNGCICVVNSGEWRQALAAAQAKQLQLYNENCHDKAFLMRCLGWTLSRITNRNFVIDHVELLFRSTTHSSQIERVGCAMAMGHCAQSHTDIILTELENVAKWEHTKDWNKKSSSSGGIFNMLKEAMPYGKTLDMEVIHLRATLVLSYGYVVYFCPVDMVVQSLEQPVLPFLRQYIANCKEVVMKEAHLETINLIAITVHSFHLNSDYEFKNRYECFSYIKQYVQSESPETLSSWIRLLAAKATASLVQLDPAISQNELVDIGSVLTNQVFPMGREKSGLKTLDPLSVTGFLLPPVLLSSTSSTRVSSFVCSTAVLHHQRCFTAPTPNSENLDGVAVQLSSKSKKEEKQRSKAAAKAEASLSNGHDAALYSSSAARHNRIDDDEASTVMDATVMQYRNAISHIVTRQPFVEPVYILLRMFFEYFVSSVDHERARAIDSTVLVLHVYAENAADCVLGHANDFHPLSNLLGRLCPRLSDSYYAVRILSIRAIWLSFKLSLLRRGHSPQDTDLVDSALFDVPAFVDEYLGNEGKMDPIKCRSVIIAISKEVEKRLPQSQVQVYLSVLLKMLDDKQSHVSSSAAQLLSIIVADRGHLLHAEAEKLISTLLENLSKQMAIQTYTELQNAFNLFSAHQQFVAIDVLLKQPLPYSTTNSDVWQMMARDTSQFTVAVDYILDLLGAGQAPSLQPPIPEEDRGVEEGVEQQPPPTPSSPLNSPTSTAQPKQHYEIIDVGGGVAVKVVCSEVCALTAALQELIKSGEPEHALFDRIPCILAALLQVLAAVVDTKFPTVQKPSASAASTTALSTTIPATKGVPKASRKMPAVPIITSELCRVATNPSNLVSQALKTLLLRIRAEQVIETMNSERAWTNITHPHHYLATISILCRSLCTHRPKFVGSLMYIMAARIDSICEAERVAACAVLSSLVTRCPKENGDFDAELLDVVVQALGKALKDPKLIVRKLAIRGHGLIGQLGASLAAKLTDPLYSKKYLMDKYSKRAVDAALVGLDDSGDRSDQLAIEAVESLVNLVAVADSKLLVQILPQLLLKIRPCFEKENPPLRAAAFSLFAGLGVCVGECEAFKESLHNNIVSVLLHLNDTDELVQQKTAHVLRSTSKLLNSDHATNLVEREIVDQKPIQNYAAFIKDFSLILAVSFPDRVNYYALNCANYFKSQSPRIRQNASLMTGFLLSALSPELRGTLSKDLVFSGLVQLLKDQNEEVRLTTAKAISCLHAYA